LLIKNNKNREAALKNEAGGDEKQFFFLLGLMVPVRLHVCIYPLNNSVEPELASSLNNLCQVQEKHFMNYKTRRPTFSNG